MHSLYGRAVGTGGSKVINPRKASKPIIASQHPEGDVAGLFPSDLGMNTDSTILLCTYHALKQEIAGSVDLDIHNVRLFGQI